MSAYHDLAVDSIAPHHTALRATGTDRRSGRILPRRNFLHSPQSHLHSSQSALHLPAPRTVTMSPTNGAGWQSCTGCTIHSLVPRVRMLIQSSTIGKTVPPSTTRPAISTSELSRRRAVDRRRCKERCKSHGCSRRRQGIAPPPRRGRGWGRGGQRARSNRTPNRGPRIIDANPKPTTCPPLPLLCTRRAEPTTINR